MIADGRPVGAIVVEHRSRTVFGIERRVASVLGQFSAVAALNLRNAALLRHVQDLAERDSLTGAANRRMFQLTLERTLTSNAAVGADRIAAVLFIDLDDFKVINDTLGHAAGDDLLIAVTDRIGGLVRQGDLVARLGGDEFAILTEDEPDLRSSRAMAERLVRDLRVPYVIGEHTITVSASIGIASARDAGADAQELVRNADVAMYMAKANGKSGFAVFDPGMHASIRARHELGTDLQHAVDLGQLRLVYQPIVSLETGPRRRPRGARALAASRPRAGRAGRVHRDRRGERLDPAHRPLGPARGVRAGGGLAGGGRHRPGPVRVRQRLGARDPAARASSARSRRRWPGPGWSRRASSSRSPRPR